MTVPAAPVTALISAQATAPSTTRTDIKAAVESVIKYKLTRTRGAASRSCQLRGAIVTLREVMYPRVGLQLNVKRVTLDVLLPPKYRTRPLGLNGLR